MNKLAVVSIGGAFIGSGKKMTSILMHRVEVILILKGRDRGSSVLPCRIFDSKNGLNDNNVATVENSHDNAFATAEPMKTACVILREAG